MKLLRQEGFELTKHNPDVVAVIGGDGTMISAIRSLHRLKVPFLGVNTGSLGFLPGLFPNELPLVPVVLKKTFETERYPLFHVKVKSGDGSVKEGEFFNEVLIRHEQPRLMEAHVFLNDIPFNYFTGDGFIISTPIGATGYAIWAGGAVMHPALPCIELTPLSPNDNRINRPLKHSMILPDSTTIRISIVKSNLREVMVACDGIAMEVQRVREIEVTLSDQYVEIIKPHQKDYFELFRNKIIDKAIDRYLETK
ncbi:NAD(+)/NADH kinase [Guggenheimella bovis]